MTRTGLPARAAYGTVAAVVVGYSGFRAGIVMFGRLLPMLHGIRPSPEYNEFLNAIALGAVAGFTAGLVGLTLPWIRRKKRRGRLQRTIVSGVFVFLLAIAIATQDLPVAEELSIVIWVIFTLAYTFVRYGVLDQARRSPTPVPAS